MKVSVIFPTLNEEKTVRACIKKAQNTLDQYSVEGEILVSDSSTDNTPVIAQKCGAKVVFCKKLGYGNAYRTAIEEAQGDILLMCDADGTYNVAELAKIVDPLLSGEADFVVGNRFTAHMEKGAMPWYNRYVGNPLLTGILNSLFGTQVRDAHCGMRGITRKAYERMDLECTGMEFASEMIVEAALCNLKIKEVPISYGRRGPSPTKLHPVQDGWRHLHFLIHRWIHRSDHCTD